MSKFPITHILPIFALLATAISVLPFNPVSTDTSSIPTLYEHPHLTSRAPQYTAELDLCGSPRCAGSGRTAYVNDGICYPDSSTSMKIDSLAGGCEVRVFNRSDWTGESAYLIETRTCWDVSVRRSFQIYC
ncbi:hypothetical protein BT63DRAFT_426038 [Microthyrium microscopicum]|uniref:Uncharacterized protein n=1 Tax=Microthyrium microscopicum TaxID=703497 RepID=A0A6A6UAY2_9PEZI|nr:hypothetical protein BT63DRAFT_426038 [Microthyrium microscopicum]